MISLRKQLDQLLLDLAWSLWTELGVAGVKRNHHNVLIKLEELLILTAVLAEIDPRLRDESLDWCSKYHHLISLRCLKSILKDMDTSTCQSFSQYSASLNALADANWPVFTDVIPWKVFLSHKSCLCPLESSALLNIRARFLFGTSARADLVTFFLTHTQSDFAISDLVELGYTKRNLAEILEELSLSGLFEKYLLRNQFRYRLIKNDPVTTILCPIPAYSPSWFHILKILIPLRNCILQNEKNSESTQLVTIRNALLSLQEQLPRLRLAPPSFQGNISSYLKAFEKWLLDIMAPLAQGNFPSTSFLKSFS